MHEFNISYSHTVCLLVLALANALPVKNKTIIIIYSNKMHPLLPGIVTPFGDGMLKLLLLLFLVIQKKSFVCSILIFFFICLFS